MNKKKVLAVFPLLFLLSGCSFIYQDIFVGIKWMNMGISIPTLETFISKIGLNITHWINGLYSWLYKTMYTNISDISKNALEFLGSFEGMESILGTIAILGVVLMAIRLAIGILKNNFLDGNDSFAPEGVTLVKRVLVGIGTLMLIPYLVVSPFVASTWIGSAVGNGMLSGQDGLFAYEIYDVMDEYGISASTYCEVGQYNTKNSSSLKHLSTKSPSVEVITQESANDFPLPQEFIDHNPEFANANNDLYGFWCGGGDGHASTTSLNVWTSLFVENDYFAETLLVNGGESIMDVFINIIMALFIGIIAFFAIFAVAKRVADLIMLICLSWWYVGTSIDDGISLALLGKKVITLCLSQFMLIVEFAIFLIICQMPTDFLGLIFKVPLVIASAFVIISTPTAIKELVHDTGTTGQALTGLGKFVK